MEFQSTRPRGARRTIADGAQGTLQFQSTRPRGARPQITRYFCLSDAFQSTRPRGARRRSTRSASCCCHFNPRARVGRDCACLHGLNYSGCAIFFANLILSVLLQAFFAAKSSV